MEKCKNCGKDIINPTKSTPKGYCCYRCYEEWTRFHKTPNCKCVICGREMYMKPSRLKRAAHGITCSIECASKLKSQYMSGEGNHQFGLKGELNASFKGKELEKENHNVIDIRVYVKDHPYSDKDGRVLKHRLIVEENFQLFDEKYFDLINGKHYLKKEYNIHHVDENHSNNDISNLQIVTRSEHTSIHNKEKILLRNSLGRITGVLKREELLETPEVDDQQPSLELTIKEGSETNS